MIWLKVIGTDEKGNIIPQLGRLQLGVHDAVQFEEVRLLLQQILADYAAPHNTAALKRWEEEHGEGTGKP